MAEQEEGVELTPENEAAWKAVLSDRPQARVVAPAAPASGAKKFTPKAAAKPPAEKPKADPQQDQVNPISGMTYREEAEARRRIEAAGGATAPPSVEEIQRGSEQDLAAIRRRDANDLGNAVIQLKKDIGGFTLTATVDLDFIGAVATKIKEYADKHNLGQGADILGHMKKSTDPAERKFGQDLENYQRLLEANTPQAAPPQKRASSEVNPHDGHASSHRVSVAATIDTGDHVTVGGGQGYSNVASMGSSFYMAAQGIEKPTAIPAQQLVFAIDNTNTNTAKLGQPA